MPRICQMGGGDLRWPRGGGWQAVGSWAVCERCGRSSAVSKGCSKPSAQQRRAQHTSLSRSSAPRCRVNCMRLASCAHIGISQSSTPLRHCPTSFQGVQASGGMKILYVRCGAPPRRKQFAAERACALAKYSATWLEDCM